MRCSILPFVLGAWSTVAHACDVALVLAVDVSGSVDPVEYEIQQRGLALALEDGLVAEALVRANASVTVLQWTGSSRQQVSVPWTTINSFEDVDRLAATVAADARVWRNFSTAIGEALDVALSLFDEVPHCRRKVIDVSGDGVSNEGRPPWSVHDELKMAGVTVNAVVIETNESRNFDLTGYFFENVIVGEEAFVVTAAGFEDYPERIRLKLIRELTEQVAMLPSDPRNR